MQVCNVCVDSMLIVFIVLNRVEMFYSIVDFIDRVDSFQCVDCDDCVDYIDCVGTFNVLTTLIVLFKTNQLITSDALDVTIVQIKLVVSNTMFNVLIYMVSSDVFLETVIA